MLKRREKDNVQYHVDKAVFRRTPDLSDWAYKPPRAPCEDANVIVNVFTLIGCRPHSHTQAHPLTMLVPKVVDHSLFRTALH